MRTFFSKDSVLKVIAVIIAIIMWLYIIIVVDPAVDVTIRDIPVKYTNLDLLSENNLCIINENKPTVTVRIRGSRKKIAKIDNKNIYATVDVANVVKTGKVSLPIGLSIPYEYNEIVSKKPYNVELSIDDVAEKEVTINVVTSGEVAKGYIAGTFEPSVKTIKLRGAASVLKNINGATALLDYDDRNADINDTIKVYLVDNSGKTIEEKSNVYDMVKMDAKEIQIKCPVYKTKVLPITVDIGSESRENYEIFSQPVNVVVYGPNEKLEEIDEIFTERVMINEIAGHGSETVNLVIPEGIMMRDVIDRVVVKADFSR